MNTGPASAVFLDIGTTNARAWLVHNSEVLAHSSAPVGVRDTARDGSNQKLRLALKDLIATAIAQNSSHQPTVVIGAGMIGSALGLAEVPHLAAPAGLAELAAGVKSFHFPEITALPIMIVPGVRTEPDVPNRQSGALDLMRGEETLCIGLLLLGELAHPATVLNLGSHWKAIEIDAGQRIRGSITSLSGEMIHTVQTATILASAVPQAKPDLLSDEWIEKGMAEERRSGLPRAMFFVRLLEQAGRTSPAERMAFLVGAFIASDLDALVRAGRFGTGQNVALVGTAALAGAWKEALAKAGMRAVVIDERQSEKGLLMGLGQILSSVQLAGEAGR